MRFKRILLMLLACMALALSAQPTQQQHEWEWYLDEVVSETFVGRNYFEYYYQPSAADMEQQRAKGEVNYFLNSPDGLNSKKVRDMIDRLMASYDDIKAVGDWHMTNTTYWKEFRYEKNKFRFTVKRKALDDGTYYVSVTETADYYKSLGKKDKDKDKPKKEATTSSRNREASAKERPTRRAAQDRKPVVLPDEEETATPEDNLAEDGDEPDAPVVSEKEQRKLDAQRREDERRELRAKQRREQEQRRAEAKAQKEAEKLKKAEEKKQRQEEERLKKEEKQRLREEERLRQRQEREAQRQERAAQRQQAAAAPAQQTAPATSRYHFTDVALWLSEKYDFTQTAESENSCTMYSTAVKDVDMAKLAIKNALKGSDARMAIPWRVNSETQAIETGYTVDGHVLVFTIGKNDEGLPTVTVTEVSGEQFELFKQSLGGH